MYEKFQFLNYTTQPSSAPEESSVTTLLEKVVEIDLLLKSISVYIRSSSSNCDTRYLAHSSSSFLVGNTTKWKKNIKSILSDSDEERQSVVSRSRRSKKNVLEIYQEIQDLQSHMILTSDMSNRYKTNRNLFSGVEK